eukprot:127860-Amorphochlora_amoeboformis.AAC.1
MYSFGPSLITGRMGDFLDSFGVVESFRRVFQSQERHTGVQTQIVHVAQGNIAKIVGFRPQNVIRGLISEGVG